MTRLIPFQRTRTRILALSLAVHVAALFLGVVIVTRPRPQSPVRSEVKFFHVRLYDPGGKRTERSTEPAGRKKHNTQNPRRTSDLSPAPKPAPSRGAPVSAPHPEVAGNGTDSQNQFPAFPVFSPRPPVTDRSLLPHSDRQVVVDVKVSAVGEVLDATLVQGIGNGLDQIVIDTVRTWRFHPATINGTPVATEAELVFPFNQSYPTAPS